MSICATSLQGGPILVTPPFIFGVIDYITSMKLSDFVTYKLQGGPKYRTVFLKVGTLLRLTQWEKGV